MPLRLLPALALVATLLGAMPGAAAQLALRHGFPLAGGELVVLVEGLTPEAGVRVDLALADAAPPSLRQWLLEHLPLLPPDDLADLGRLSFLALADRSGVLLFEVPLADLDDAGRPVALAFHDDLAGASAELRLLVQPPTVLLPVADGLARVELLGGRRLLPDVPATGDLLGAALAADGLTLHALFDGGRLQQLSADDYRRGPLVERFVDPAGEWLARSPGGPAFIVARLAGRPFAPAGKLMAVDARRPDLFVDPLGQPVAGRGWAVTPDGLSAFVAEDDLIVREVDVLGWRVRAPFTAGFNGDRLVADMGLDDARLMVLTRPGTGQAGSLTSLDLRTGVVSPWPLGMDPRRLVSLGAGLSLVTPQTGALVQLVEGGVPAGLLAVGGADERLLDAAVVAGDVLLLVARPGAPPSLRLWSAERGLRLLATTGPVPAATTLVSAGGDLALLLGAPDGTVQRVVPSLGVLEAVEGLVVAPGAGHHLLP